MLSKLKKELADLDNTFMVNQDDCHLGIFFCVSITWLGLLFQDIPLWSEWVGEFGIIWFYTWWMLSLRKTMRHLF
jgi:hypothetical protein